MELSRLEALPNEIKARVFRQLFLDQKIHIHDPYPFSDFPCASSRSPTPNPLAILRTSKTLKQDAEPHFDAVAIFKPCPCFLSRTETGDFEVRLSEVTKHRLQPLLSLWDLRRTTQVFHHSFTFYSGLQQFKFTYVPASYPSLEIISVAYVIAHVRKRGLSTWIRMPSPDNLQKDQPIVYVKVDHTDAVTILSQNQALGQKAREFLLGIKCWTMLSEDYFPTETVFVLDESSTKFDMHVVESLTDDWLDRYHYECCMEGQSAAARKFGWRA